MTSVFRHPQANGTAPERSATRPTAGEFILLLGVGVAACTDAASEAKMRKSERSPGHFASCAGRVIRMVCARNRVPRLLGSTPSSYPGKIASHPSERPFVARYSSAKSSGIPPKAAAAESIVVTDAGGSSSTGRAGGTSPRARGRTVTVTTRRGCLLQRLVARRCVTSAVA